VHTNISRSVLKSYIWQNTIIFEDVMVDACILIRTEKGKFIDVIERIKSLETVVDTYPVLGRYDIVVHLIASNGKELGKNVIRISNIAGVVFTETLVEIEN
jgi:DNA-binding Lrp family transcriptional regulator